MCTYNEDESALTTFFENTGSVIMEKCNIAFVVSLKCEESNHYNSNCLLYQRCCLLCTSYGQYKAARTVKTTKVWHRRDYFFIPLREQLCQKRI